MIIIYCIITFVGSYYNTDVHIPTNVIVISGSSNSRVTFDQSQRSSYCTVQ